MTLTEAAKRSGIKHQLSSRRYQRGLRGEELFKPVENHSIIVEYEGEKMNLAEASKKSGINYSSLYSRYHKQGLRGEELFKPVRKTNKKV